MKLKTIFICEKCGYSSQKWLGKCPECESWNSFIEDTVNVSSKTLKMSDLLTAKQTAQPTPLTKLNKAPENRIKTNINELDRVLGGGIVEGSMILLSGEPGIGKSTLTLKVCEKVAEQKTIIFKEKPTKSHSNSTDSYLKSTKSHSNSTDSYLESTESHSESTNSLSSAMIHSPSNSISRPITNTLSNTYQEDFTSIPNHKQQPIQNPTHQHPQKNLQQQSQQQKDKILYISGEESPSQIGLRAKRMGINNEDIFIIGETNLETILNTIIKNKLNYKLIVLDSIQVISSEEIPSIAGSISQVRYCTEQLMKLAKNNKIPIIIVGHVTKDGNLAGPKILEHLVDTVLLIEGDRLTDLRIVRSIKNRFGSTNEIGLFEMKNSGMEEVENASKHFIEERQENSIGSAITATIEGTRPLFIEVQALTSKTPFGYPKRASSGYDVNRLQLLLAVINKHLNIDVSQYDVYVNVVGGYKLNDTASDLAIVMAIISSIKKTPLPQKTIYIAEIGLSGELRKTSKLESRKKESKKLGFEEIITNSSKDLITVFKTIN